MLLIKDHLVLLDIFCLRRTCSTTHRVFQQTLSHPSTTTRRQISYMLTLDDEITNRPSANRCCAYCITSHHISLFTQPQLLHSPTRRRCRGADRKVRFCPHRTFAFTELRHLATRPAQGAFGARPVFQCAKGVCAVFQPTLHFNGWAASLHSSLYVGVAVAGEGKIALSPPAKEIMQQQRHLWLCPHLRLGDARVLAPQEQGVLKTGLFGGDVTEYSCRGPGCDMVFAHDEAVGSREVTLRVRRTVFQGGWLEFGPGWVASDPGWFACSVDADADADAGVDDGVVAEV